MKDKPETTRTFTIETTIGIPWTDPFRDEQSARDWLSLQPNKSALAVVEIVRTVLP